jgi:hypothetical protein
MLAGSWISFSWQSEDTRAKTANTFKIFSPEYTWYSGDSILFNFTDDDCGIIFAAIVQCFLHKGFCTKLRIFLRLHNCF